MPTEPSECVGAFSVRQVRPDLNDFKGAYLRLAPSAIHQTGMFAASRLCAHYLVRKYEWYRLVKNFADQREVKYEEQGLDCYFMTVSENRTVPGSLQVVDLSGSVVIDGTIHGNMTRFSNPSRSPTATRKKYSMGMSRLRPYLRSHVSLAVLSSLTTIA